MAVVKELVVAPEPRLAGVFICREEMPKYWWLVALAMVVAVVLAPQPLVLTSKPGLEIMLVVVAPAVGVVSTIKIGAPMAF